MRKAPSWTNWLATCALTLSCACLPFSQVLAESPQEWYRQGQLAVQQAQKRKINNRIAQNVIIFIGDGMNLPTVAAARILAGQSLGKKGEEHILSFEKLPHVALSKTYCTNAQVTDSAAAMTAIITGVKTKDGLLSVNQKVTPHKASTVPGNKLLTLLERAEKRGLATGVVSTTRITHATPGACYAHSPDRDWEGDADITSEDPANATFPDIARQLLEFPYGNGLEVALGGGRSSFQPETTPDPEYPTKFGKRKDGRDLTQEWVNRHQGSAYVWNKAQFDAINPAATRHLLGLFERSHMRYEKDRAQDAAGEPSLSEMTAKAIDILAKNRKGYVLMVEGGRIDHAHHANNAYHALHDTLEFARAVQVALDKTNPKNTLIVVTADHGHVLCFTGYPTRGNPILGLVTENDKWGKPTDPPTLTRGADGLPFTTLLYGNGPGYVCPRPDLTGVDTSAPTYRQQSAVPWASDGHSGEDVPIYAGGPGAHLFHGVQEESYIFHAIMAAMKLDSR
ncbi:MAG: alkaline phosphatase [Thermodesulfobacteriota bacterium]